MRAEVATMTGVMIEGVVPRRTAAIMAMQGATEATHQCTRGTVSIAATCEESRALVAATNNTVVLVMMIERVGTIRILESMSAGVEAVTHRAPDPMTRRYALIKLMTRRQKQRHT